MLYNAKNPHGGDVYDGKVVLDFSENTNPFGPPESVKEAIRRSAELARRYPDPYCRKLTKISQSLTTKNLLLNLRVTKLKTIPGLIKTAYMKL